jgi:MYXO-CTERM domain-containing protein
MLLPSILWVLAGGPSLAPMSDPAAINGGETVEPCGWPSVVLLRGNGYLCTGNLIHPEIVATAAHCIAVMEPETEVEFGDTANTANAKVDVEYCTGSPDFIDTKDGTIPFDEVGNDWGFCKLVSPITDVEPIPVIYGCEMDLIQPGAEIVRVGFGRETLSTSQFFKRELVTQINEIAFTGANGWPTQLTEAGNGEGTCPGDSGGPSFIRVPAADGGEDAWRMVAIQSTQPLEDGEGNEIECGDAPNNTAVISQGVELIESESGIDVTPCFDTAGGWDPSFECQGFPIDPGAGGGTWAMGCEPGPLSGFSAACGVSFDVGNPDASAPVVTIVDPAGDQSLPWEGEAIAIHVIAEADDGPNGWGIASVDLVILAQDDSELGRFTDENEPWEWDPEFPQGSFRIRAIATDNAGLLANSQDVQIDIGVESEDTGDGGVDTTGEGGTTDEPADDDGTDGGDDDEDDGDDESGDDGVDGTGGITGGLDRGGDNGGCGCRTDRNASSNGFGDGFGIGGLALVVLAAVRRRRR